MFDQIRSLFRPRTAGGIVVCPRPVTLHVSRVDDGALLEASYGPQQGGSRDYRVGKTIKTADVPKFVSALREGRNLLLPGSWEVSDARNKPAPRDATERADALFAKHSPQYGMSPPCCEIDARSRATGEPMPGMTLRDPSMRDRYGVAQHVASLHDAAGTREQLASLLERTLEVAK